MSQFLLNYLELNGKFVAKNVAGEQDNLSFRNLVEILLVNETDIQIERSPIERKWKQCESHRRNVAYLDYSSLAQMNSCNCD